jgi:hypothetical protein
MRVIRIMIADRVNLMRQIRDMKESGGELKETKEQHRREVS